MASIKKRPNGTYQASIYTGRDANGKQEFEYVTRDTLKECKAAAREIEDALEKGTYLKIKNMSVVDAIENWIELKRSELSPGTIHLYKNTYLKAHYKPFFKNIKLKEIVGNEMLIRELKAKLLEKQNPNTVRKEMSVLDKILRETMRDKNPCKYVELPAKKKSFRRVPTDEEFLQIHKAVLGTKDEPIVLLAGWCSMRLGEICAIKPNDVFKEKRIIKVDESLSINDEYDYEPKDPKSDNGIREVAVPAYLMDLICEHIKKQKKIPERVFNYLPNSYSQRFNKIIKDNNLSKVTFHSLKHYHITWMFENGYSDKYAAERSGNDLRTIKLIYQHLRDELKAKTDNDLIEKLPSAVSLVEEKQKRDSSN